MLKTYYWLWRARKLSRANSSDPKKRTLQGAFTEGDKFEIFLLNRDELYTSRSGRDFVPKRENAETHFKILRLARLHTVISLYFNIRFDKFVTIHC